MYEPEEIEKIIIENEKLKEEVKALQKIIAEGREGLVNLHRQLIEFGKEFKKDLNEAR
jgi:cell division septum initiation protein DivIVA